MCPAGQLLGSITPVPLQYLSSVQERQIPSLGKGWNVPGAQGSGNILPENNTQKREI